MLLVVVSHASSYLLKDNLFAQDVFVEWNSWTQTETYLLVERLSSSTQAEEWKEVVEQCDASATYETEAYHIKARRKFAVAKGLALEAVSLEDVEASPQGIHGWADINISVPGIEEASTSGDPVPTTPAGSITRKRSHSTSPEDEEKAPANTASDSKGPGSNKKPKAENPKAKPAAKKKSESQELRMAEKSAKNLIVLIQRAQQVVDTITGHVDSFPSEWAWSKSFLEEFHRLQGQLRTALSPASGDDLTEFVNELKTSVISPSEAKQMKKKFGERYQAMLTLFVDRCTAVSEQFLGFNNLFPGPATLAILK